MNTYRVRRIPFTAANAEVKHKCDKHRGKDYIQSCCNKELWLTVVTGTVEQSGKSIVWSVNLKITLHFTVALLPCVIYLLITLKKLVCSVWRFCPIIIIDHRTDKYSQMLPLEKGYTKKTHLIAVLGKTHFIFHFLKEYISSIKFMYI